jgi:ATP-dependent RNA helicase DeaD
MFPPFPNGLPQELADTITARGFSTLTKVQSAVVDATSLTHDLRVSSQTGSGKTAAVGIAIGRTLLSEGPRPAGATQRSPTVILLTPTRELAAQVQTELEWLLAKVPDSSVDVVTGGTSVVMERKRLARGPRVLVATPGRLLDHLTGGGVDGGSVQTVVLDEADQMLDMGFRDDLEAILQKLPARNRTHLVSATFSGEVERIAHKYQTSPLKVEGSPLGQANRDIEHVAHVVDVRHRFDALLNILLLNQATPSDGAEGRALVFARTRIDTLEVAERLQQLGIAAEPMSGDLAQAQRTRTLKGFKSGQINTIVATDVAARGLDVEGVGLVVHLDPPTDPDTMTHRSGRTGRAGRKGKSILLLPPQARRRVERLLAAAKIQAAFEPVPTPEKVLKAYQKLHRRRVYDAVQNAEEKAQAKTEATPGAAPSELQTFAQKLLQEKPAELVVLGLLSLLELGPPVAPREVAHAFEHHSGGRERDRNWGPPRRFPRNDRPESGGNDAPRTGFQDRSPASPSRNHAPRGPNGHAVPRAPNGHPVPRRPWNAAGTKASKAEGGLTKRIGENSRRPGLGGEPRKEGTKWRR